MESSVDPPRVVKLNVYPVKSCKALTVSEISFDDFGVVDDRRFMMIDGNHRYLSQRRFGILTTVVAKIEIEDGKEFLSLSAQSMDRDLRIETVKEGPRMDANLWDCSVRMIDQGDEAAKWCNDLIGQDGGGAIRLVSCASETTSEENFQRLVGNVPISLLNRVSEVQVALANESPVSLVSMESLADLNEKMTQNGVDEVALDRFRMNIEVSGCSRPFEEDEWLLVNIGEVPFLVYEYCEVGTVNVVYSYFHPLTTPSFILHALVFIQLASSPGPFSSSQRAWGRGYHTVYLKTTAHHPICFCSTHAALQAD